ncbi:MAG TPA: methyltransferase domain-containing protein, partial [Candidatus Binatus sp.]|nr:methyltransferase domain-containing protein [Candidatus Binatus sp.]
YHIRSLRDRQQFSDPDGRAERAGISSASWPIFGVVWPAGIALAQEMSHFAVAGKHILEVGCGIGLCSLVLQRRGANITASDYHPLAEEFLSYNALRNGLPPIKFQNAPWAESNPELGRFDLIIGSDLLYERDHPVQLAAFIACHTESAANVIIADPGRTRCGQFSAKMAADGYSRTEQRLHFVDENTSTPRGRIMNFLRSHR